MKKLLLLFALVLLSFQSWAQITAVVKDGNGVTIGFPLEWGGWHVSVLRQGIIIPLQIDNGTVSHWKNRYFVNPTCTGVAFADTGGVNPNVTYSNPHIVSGFSEIPPRPLFLIPKLHPSSQEVLYSSEITAPNIVCDVLDTPVAKQLVPISDFEIEDPTIYGLEILEGTNEWGYQGPITIETVQSEVIYCNSFESLSCRNFTV